MAITDVEHGSTFDLRVAPITKWIDGRTYEMLAYNGSIPGPTLRVRQGSQIAVVVSNDTEMDTTVHWHGLRLENRFDGVPHETQAPIGPGETYTHRLTFPDAGLYWYHPHIREDYAQELGLYGNVIVDPTDVSYWPAVDREIVLTLDDILIEDGAITPFDPRGATFTAMGRYGNVLLTGGDTHQRFAVAQGEVVRLYLTNTANTRVFKIALPGARMKLTGADGGRYEREVWVDAVVLAPSERAIVDVRFDEPGAVPLQHVTPGRTYELGTFDVTGDPTSRWAPDFERLRINAEMVAERERAAQHMLTPPDKILALVAEMDTDETDIDGPVVYFCPMHPDVARDEAGSCPRCGMKLLPRAAESEPDSADAHGHHHDDDAMEGGIEWEDLMLEVNRTTNTSNMRWKVVDRTTGAENAAIDWSFIAGDQVKIRIVNEMQSDHPMHHPFHIHGERFLVLARDGEAEPNLVWKDTVLIPTGQVVDILMDASNPGLWMAHCHIAEHLEAGMMFSFRVRPRDDRP
ncbi:MAG TPA: multicopper oxidase family protein [Euzebyales bacterium]|nr:multicopper oxidase family protein [Euzebyales bacterium]